MAMSLLGLKPQGLVTKKIVCLSMSLQMTSNDKDFRFMATNDLMTELQKDSIKLDDDSERKVSTSQGSR